MNQVSILLHSSASKLSFAFAEDIIRFAPFAHAAIAPNFQTRNGGRGEACCGSQMLVEESLIQCAEVNTERSGTGKLLIAEYMLTSFHFM